MSSNTLLQLLEPLDQTVSELFILRHLPMSLKTLAESRDRIDQSGKVERRRAICHSAASLSASCAALSSTAFASTNSTMWSSIAAPSIVWSVLPARYTM